MSWRNEERRRDEWRIESDVVVRVRKDFIAKREKKKEKRRATYCRKKRRDFEKDKRIGDRWCTREKDDGKTEEPPRKEKTSEKDVVC